LNPDKLAQSKKKAMIEAVSEKKVLTDGTHVIELYHIQNSGHNDGMLIAYLPKEKVLVEADLYTAGPPNAAAPNPVSPYTLSLVDNLERLKLDYEIVLGLHGRQATKADPMKGRWETN
jgi:glyoxylase-like metal-dependent hydrolase (beta-lactamase superfamily II)